MWFLWYVQYLISVHERDLVYHYNHSILPEIQYVNWCFTTGFLVTVLSSIFWNVTHYFQFWFTFKKYRYHMFKRRTLFFYCFYCLPTYQLHYLSALKVSYMLMSCNPDSDSDKRAILVPWLSLILHRIWDKEPPFFVI